MLLQSVTKFWCSNLSKGKVLAVIRNYKTTSHHLLGGGHIAFSKFFLQWLYKWKFIVLNGILNWVKILIYPRLAYEWNLYQFRSSNGRCSKRTTNIIWLIHLKEWRWVLTFILFNSVILYGIEIYFGSWGHVCLIVVNIWCHCFGLVAELEWCLRWDTWKQRTKDDQKLRTNKRPQRELMIFSQLQTC